MAKTSKTTKSDNSRSREDRPATSSARKLPAHAKVKPAGADMSALPTGGAHRPTKRKQKEPDSDDEEEEELPKKKKRKDTSARKTKDRGKEKTKRSTKATKRATAAEADETQWVDDDPVDDPVEEDTEEFQQHLLDTKLARSKVQWGSHYIDVKAEKRKGSWYHVFHCAHTGSEHIRKASSSTSSNLKNHADECDRIHGNSKTGRQPKITERLARKFKRGHFRFLLARWFTTRHRPDLMVEDKEFYDVCVYLNPEGKPPSRQTLHRDVQEIYEYTREELKTLLAAHEGRFNLIFDCWTSPNGHEFLGVLVSFAHEGKIFVVPLDMIEMLVRHTGENLSDAIFALLKEFGIEERTLGHVGDNASNNDTMLDHLGDHYKAGRVSIAGRHTQVRCFGHILNLVYHSVCSVFEPAKKTTTNEPLDEEEEWEDYEDDEETPEEEQRNTSEGRRTEEERRELEQLWAESERASVGTPSAQELKEGRSAMKKIITLGHRCANKNTMQNELSRLCKLNHLKKRKMVKRVGTRWNTMYAVVARALDLKEPLNALCMSPAFNVGRPAQRLKRFLLTPKEWNILAELLPTLERLWKATVMMSTNAYPMLHQVIPSMDILNNTFEQALLDKQVPHIVLFGLEKGLQVLDKYYSRTDESVMWKTAMLLHPRRRKQYMKEAKWKRSWIDSAVSSAEEIWQDTYLTTVEAVVTKVVPGAKPLDEFDLLNAPPVGTKDVFDTFINGNQSDEDAIPFWTGQLAPRGTKPTRPSEALARMALDFLSAPATGTDVERLFSHGGLVVSKRRHNLSPNSIREQVVLSRWMQVDGLVPEVALIKLLNEKHRRTAVEDSDSDNSDMEVDEDIEEDETGRKVTQKKRKGKGKAVDLSDDSSDDVKMDVDSSIEISSDDDSSDEDEE